MIKLFRIFALIFLLSETLSAFSENHPNQTNDSLYNFNTDTIKTRLKILNNKTPIEISYTPELEELIKEYLKTRTKHFNNRAKIIDYYFPIFETAPVEKIETAPVEKIETAPVDTTEASVDTVQEVLGDMMGDAPACDECGHITIRNGSCYKCLNCGNSLGCS